MLSVLSHLSQTGTHAQQNWPVKFPFKNLFQLLGSIAGAEEVSPGERMRQALPVIF